MSVLPILRWPDARLGQVCAPVKGDAGTLARDMLETMYAADGRGLAAPQVGQMLRLFVMDVGWKDGASDPLIFINPEVTETSGDLATRDEGCLSIPGVLVPVCRPAEVTMRWYGMDGTQAMRRFGGFAAACLQHEMDHLDGVVTFDHMDPDRRAMLEADYAR